MGATDIVRHILDWLRAGYPQGVPQEDYVVLLGVLRHRLTEDEVRTVAETVAQESPAEFTQEQITEAIRRAILETPAEADVRRVESILVASGWKNVEGGRR